MRGVFFDEDQARAAVAHLLRQGFAATCERERLAGEDDDEDHPWVVSSDAPTIALELLVEELDGWLDLDTPPPPSVPMDLPSAPRRSKR